MKHHKLCSVYIMTNKYNTTLYIGMTSNLVGRVYQHKNKVLPGFTSKYNLNKLVYYENTEDVMSAITREKQIKKWSHQKKRKLVTKLNPKWKDLSKDWF